MVCFPRHVATAREQAAEQPIVPEGGIFQLGPGRLLLSLVLHRCRHVLFTIGTDDKSRVYGKPERLDHETAAYAKSGEFQFTRNSKTYRDLIAGVRGERCRSYSKIASCPIAMK